MCKIRKGKPLSASKNTLNYEKEIYGNRKTNSQFPDMRRGDMYLKTNTKWMLNRMQKVLCTLGLGNAVVARPHYIQHTWTLRSGRSLVMISSTRLNFHKFSSNARHEYIVTRRRWPTKVNTGVKSNGKLPVWGKKSHGCLGGRHRGWHRREHFESGGSTSRETLTRVRVRVSDLCYYSCSHSTSAGQPTSSLEQCLLLAHLCGLPRLERHTAKNRCEKCVQN